MFKITTLSSAIVAKLPWMAILGRLLTSRSKLSASVFISLTARALSLVTVSKSLQQIMEPLKEKCAGFWSFAGIEHK